MQCRSNVKQVLLALHNYHDVHRVFPLNTSFTGDLGPLSKSRSWIQGVLPYVDQGNLYEIIDPHASTQANRFPAEFPLTVLQCPSDVHPGRLGHRADVPVDWELGVTNYKTCCGSNWDSGTFVHSESTGRFPNSNDGLNEGNGLMCSATLKGPVMTRMRDVTDGTSNTFAVGETVAGWTKWAWWYSHNAATGTCAIPLNYKVPGVRPEDNLVDWPHNFGFMSRHNGGGVFGLVDGSARFVSDSVDLGVYRAVSTIQGGEVVGEF